VVDMTPTNISWSDTMFTLEANVSVRLNATNDEVGRKMFAIHSAL